MAKQLLPDYEALKTILEKQLDRNVSLQEAKSTGNCLLKIYEILLSTDRNMI